MRDTKLIYIFIFLFGILKSQTDTNLLVHASTKTLKKLGVNALNQHDPTTAIPFFEAYIKRNKTDAKIMNLLAVSYFAIRDYERAQKMFLNAYTTNKEKVPEALYYHALMQKSNGLYDSAKINFQKFKKAYKGSEKKLKKQANKEVAFCDSIQKTLGKQNKIIIQHLDTNINKINTEGAPINLDDNTLVFTSLRTEKKEFLIEDDTAQHPIKRKLYVAKRKYNIWRFVGEFASGLNDEDFNTGNACFSPDRKRVYFTRCKLNMNDEMICAIYVSEKNGNVWSEPVKLPKNINNPKYSSTMPAVNIDPSKGNDVIYFVSNNKKGKGGLDIWYTVFDKKKNIYKEPKNAGTKINTIQNEMSPFFDSETRSLYFSSEGLGGLGGYDVIKAIGDGKKWLSVENLGQPVNSGADDIYYTISTNREEGFFVSNRKGGNALKNSTCCDDIYYYKHMEYVKINLVGNVSDILDPFEIIAQSKLDIYIKDKKTQEKILVKTIESDDSGNYNTSLEPGQDYVIVARKKDYLGTTEEVSTKDIIVNKELKANLRLAKKSKKPISIPNIQYAFGRAELLESSKLILDTVILRLMISNPELIIEIQSHTDSKGNDKFNEKLSQKRAESVVNYLIAKGISIKRLIPKGYGETKPIAPNENADGSDNPEGRALNRRTDFSIIGVLDDEESLLVE